MNDTLWGLIQDEAQAIQGYFLAIHKAKECAEKDPKCAATIPVIMDIIADEQDHLNALTYMYEQLTGNKSAMDTITVAKKEFSKAKAVEIYKESLGKED